MDSFQQPIGDMHASARVTVGGTFEGIAPGFVSVGLAASVFTLTLAEGQRIAATNASIKVCNAAGSAVQMMAAQTADNIIEVRGFTGASVLTPAAFCISVHRKAIG